MENSNQPEKLHAIPPKQLNTVSKCFDSEEAMKTFYLQMANTLNVNIQLEGCQDFTRLENLHRKFRQFLDSLQPITEHEWKRGISEIQNACGAYLLQNQLAKKELLRINNEIGQHLQFITELAGNTGFLKQLYGNLNCHFQNLNFLMKKMQERSKKEV